MNPLVAFVQSNAYDLAPGGMRVPPLVWSAFVAFNKVHRMWRYYRLFQTVRQPAGFSQLVAGCIGNALFTPPLIFRLAGQFLMVATRLLECSQQQAALCRSGWRWMAAVKGDYPTPVHVEWERRSSLSWISPSTVHWLNVGVQSILERIKRIASSTLNLGKHVFLLSMLIMDVVEEITWMFKRPGTYPMGVDETFVNIDKCLDAIVENKETLLSGLTENRKLVEMLVRNTPVTYTQMHDGISRALRYAELFHRGYKKVSEVAGDVLIEGGKQVVGGCMVVGGCADYRPLCLAQKNL